jgi:hypothetical protein
MTRMPSDWVPISRTGDLRAEADALSAPPSYRVSPAHEPQRVTSNQDLAVRIVVRTAYHV